MANMLLVLHILLAFGGLIFSSIVYVNPSKPGIKSACALVGLTLLSGAWLVFSSGSKLVPACLSGLVYLAICLPVIYFARLKFQKQRQ